MKDYKQDFLSYIGSQKRYSARTVRVYSDSLDSFIDYAAPLSIPEALNLSLIRSYEVYLMDTRKLKASSVQLHLSVLGSLCNYLVRCGVLKTNPLRTLKRPKIEKRLPVTFRAASLEEYLSRTAVYSAELCTPECYPQVLARTIIVTLYGTGIRRSELIDLRRDSLDTGRCILRVHGKGDKTRQVPLEHHVIECLCAYMQLRDSMHPDSILPDSPLFLTPSGRCLYPVFVDRCVKRELDGIPSITTRRSPHVFRHTIATELLDGGTDINSIKEMLGHSSLAATQVYTHSSIEQLKQSYAKYHPLSGSDIDEK